MKKIIASILIASALAAYAADKVEVRIEKENGEKLVKTIELKSLGNGVERLEIEPGDIPMRARKVDIVHQNATAQKGDEGYWVLPNGMIGTYRLDNSRYSVDRHPLQMYGMKTKAKTFAGIIKGMKYEYSLVVEVKNGKYEVYPRFDFLKLGYEPYESIIIDYYTLKGDDANYSGMGRAYRKYQLESGVVKPIKERMKSQPHLAYAYQAPEIRIRQAWKPVPSKIKYQTADAEPPVKPVVTFKRVGEIIDELKSKGVEKAELCLVGWNIGGHDGRYPQLFPVEPKLGTEADLRDLIQKAKDAGYLIVCHTNNTDCYFIADTFSYDITGKLPDGTIQRRGDWAGGQTFALCAQVAWDRYVKADHQKIRDLGFDGLHYIDVISCIKPDSCHDPRHPLNRKQNAEYVNKMLANARAVFGGSASEGPYDHVAANMDYALYISFNVLRKQPDVTDRVVPIWQIAYNGIILSNPSAETTNYTLKDAKTRLKFIEFGGRPAFYYHSSFRDDGRNWMGGAIDLRCQTQEELRQSGDALKRAFDEFSKLKHLQLEFMDSHEEIAPNVFVTRWANGDEIVCNYTDKDYEYRGETVKPMSYNFIAKKCCFWWLFSKL